MNRVVLRWKFRNNNWKYLTTARPIIPDCLDRFIKTNNIYALNQNYEMKTGYKTDTSIDIEINTSVIDYVANEPFLVQGCLNPNPAGSISYRRRFLILVTLNCTYTDKLVYKVDIKWLTDKPDGLDIIGTINGVQELPQPFTAEKFIINLDYQNTTHPDDKFITFNNIINLGDFMPVMLNKPSQPELYNFQNLSN